MHDLSCNLKIPLFSIDESVFVQNENNPTDILKLNLY